ncbi:hypothetical protein COW36_05270 [bacterium (Candidatus Blackallbacteria) CG17_big_fil_post_rev_8_21_14_2_50_48_46]|uniref:Putative antitoxin VapB45-like DNA-binding HTH domain-containing protein n=1 Tax=bacterium (Candidatus Blackallbacteria) CG17_big_fil_post_rev_8_21_14_2_50_48_46 TaxID=2014261 RepID=A0A2M7G9E0_9BACT|nr:MAG: hypothetical protein COW64_03670 [bacterium (Candidatus Blackallbacteria) CG18_big_fil_WC_8_21_14_2_50_49_26]PIW18707.1 MAG: hypothetical protein COW36_05270 [bacterium (Candidatus Blackallbacteria) CG17_big_fil_post_rev_8_21_14_2_50_48_46]PIW46306.1 MAG: hypothetical protein COW20_15405 [bacterium (Candidatus Blackallbacteria) CG13_big_fil_rev_8_21_14_2_50_49_14]
MDRRYRPIYSLPEVASYLHIQPATLRSWVLGRHYVTRNGEKRFSEPLITIADPEHIRLSFINMIEAHVLSAIRKTHQIPMHNIRPAIDHLAKKYGVEHPLAEYNLLTDGLDLFIEEFNQLVNLTNRGQLTLKTFLESYLKRIERDSTGLPARFYPAPTIMDSKDSKIFVVDFNVSFGRMTINGTGIPVESVLDRYDAGEDLKSLADDFNIDVNKLEAVISAA